MQHRLSKSVRRANRRQRLGVAAILAVALCWVLLLSSTLPAQATQGSDTIETHVELVSETALGTVVDTTIPIARGFLPGGSTVFDPAPTVTLEVTGRNQGGTGIGGTWNVTLTDSTGASVATVAFPKASGYQLRTASFSWPSSDRDLDAIVLNKVNQGQNIAGTFDLTKAYLKIHQVGVIKKTAGRVALGTKETGVSSPSGSRLQAPAVFTYDATAFDPAPTIRLRATAQGNPCLELYLHDDTVDAQTPPNGVVVGSDLTFSGYRNAESTALALVDQHTYVLHAAFSTDQSCLPSFDTGHGAAHSIPNPSPPGTGDFFSADLILEQATTDTAGLNKTVGWYPGVTAATDISNNANLNFLFNSPQANVPNAIQGSWLYTAKLTSPAALGGSIGANAVNLSSGGSSLAVPAHLSTTEFSTPAPATFTLPPAGADIDTQGFVDNTSTTRGRISLSLLQLKYELRDLTGPTVFNFGTPGTPTHAFNPNRASVTIVADLCDYSSMNWTITLASVNSHPGLVLPSGSGSGSAVANSPWNGNCTSKLHASWTWNGKDTSANVVPDDDYIATLTPTDGAGIQTTVSPLTLTVDTIDPDVGDLTATQPLIGANADAPQNLSTFEDASITGASSWAFTVTQAPNAPVRGITGTSTSLSVPFNGKTVSNVAVPSGPYVGRLVATDLAGNQAIRTASITVDNSPPSITGYGVSNPFFSPNASGTKDTTTIAADVSDSWGQVSWTLDFKNSQGATVRSFDSSTSSLPQCWDGSSSAAPTVCADATHGAPVADGTYTPVLTVTDGGHNSNVLYEPDVVVDTVKPKVTDLFPGASANSVFSSQRLGAKLSDSGGSGLVTASVQFHFGSDVFSGTQLITLNGWIETPAESLTTNQNYEATVELDDEAGNHRTKTWQFRKIGEPNIGTPASASLSGAGVRVGPGSTIGTEQWRFTPHIEVGETSVGFNTGSAHAGWGSLATDVALGNAVFKMTVAGQEQAWVQKPFGIGESRRVYRQAHYLDSGGTQTDVKAFTGGGDLLPLTIDLPVGIDSARIDLQGAATQSHFAALCDDPSVGSPGCSTDPLRFFVRDPLATRIKSRIADLPIPTGDPDPAQARATGPNNLWTGMSVLVRPTLQWMPLRPIAGVVCEQASGSGSSIPTCYLDGVAYAQGMLVVGEGQYQEVCAATSFCAAPSTAAYGEDLKYNCVIKQNGGDKPVSSGQGGPPINDDNTPNDDKCSQYDYFYSYSTLEDFPQFPDRTIYWMMVEHYSDWGYDDATYDELGIHFAARDKRWAKAWAPGESSIPVYKSFYWGDTYPRDTGFSYYENGVQHFYDDEAQNCRDATATKPPGTYNGAGYAMAQHFEDGGSQTNYHGLGSGSSTGSQHGHPQLHHPFCSYAADRAPIGFSPYNLAYGYRVYAARVSGYFDLVSDPPQHGTDGRLVLTFGHVTTKTSWTFNVSGPGCGAGYGTGCSVLGFGFTPQATESDAWEDRVVVDHAFNY